LSDFPVEKLKPLASRYHGEPGDITIEMPLKPFKLDGQEVNTSIRLEGVNLPTTDASELIGQSFDFPLNPEDGYIDGSIYMDHAHHPVDVSRISFITNKNKTLIQIKLKVVLTYEGLGDYSDASTELSVPIQGS
jgi:hypothetical protein